MVDASTNVMGWVSWGRNGVSILWIQINPMSVEEFCSIKL